MFEPALHQRKYIYVCDDNWRVNYSPSSPVCPDPSGPVRTVYVVEAVRATCIYTCRNETSRGVKTKSTKLSFISCVTCLVKLTIDIYHLKILQTSYSSIFNINEISPINHILYRITFQAKERKTSLARINKEKTRIKRPVFVYKYLFWCLFLGWGYLFVSFVFVLYRMRMTD